MCYQKPNSFYLILNASTLTSHCVSPAPTIIIIHEFKNSILERIWKIINLLLFN